MLRFESKCSQDQEVQRALWKVNALCSHVLPFHFYTRYMISCRSTRETSQTPTLHHRGHKGHSGVLSSKRYCPLLPVAFVSANCQLLIAGFLLRVACRTCWRAVDHLVTYVCSQF